MKYKEIIQRYPSPSKHKTDYIDPDMGSKVLRKLRPGTLALALGSAYSVHSSFICEEQENKCLFHMAINYLSACIKSLKQKLQGRHIVAVHSLLNAKCYLCCSLFRTSVCSKSWLSQSFKFGEPEKTPNLWFDFLLIFVLFSVYFVTRINRLIGEKYILGLCIAPIMYELLIVL